MTEEQQLKATCLELCKGDMSNAKQAYEWLSKPKVINAQETTHTLRDGRRVCLSPDGTWALMGMAPFGEILG